MSEPIDPKLLAKSRRKFGGDFGDKATPPDKDKSATKATTPAQDDGDALIDAEWEQAMQWAKKAGEGE